MQVTYRSQRKPRILDKFKRNSAHAFVAQQEILDELRWKRCECLSLEGILAAPLEVKPVSVIRRSMELMLGFPAKRGFLCLIL